MATAAPDRCPSCGAAFPADAPRGHCPLCLIREGLGGPSLSLAHPGTVGVTVDLGGAPVLETIAATVGPVPRVLLRDTDPGAGPPVLRPTDRAAADPAVRYRIDGEIARGGMGAVLRGRDPDLGRDVAVKVLREDFGDNPEMVRRFVEEAQIGGQLQHPGIVPVYELGTFTDRRPFFSMKLVKGRTLAALLAARPSPADGLARFLGIFEQVAQTVAYAHARGVIHRDLKPSNVMIGSYGEVQVMDWGLAKILTRGGAADDATAGLEADRESVIATLRPGDDSVVDRSRAGSVMGTPSYMAPEQARGEIEAVDERADVFALGSILCEVLVGQPVFTGRTSAEIQRKAARGETADALARLDAGGADAELVALAKHCLAIEPGDRPRDAGAIASSMAAYLAGVQERLRVAERERAVAQARAAEERKRRKLQIGLAIASLALMALGGLGAAYAMQLRHDRETRVARVLAEATASLARARQRPEDPSRWRETLAVVRRIGDDLDAGIGPEAEARLVALRGEAQDGLDDAERDAELRRKLAEIRANQTLEERIAGAYTAAFREAGLDLEALPVDELATLLRRRPDAVVAEVVAFFDHLRTALDWSETDGPMLEKLGALTHAVDTDPDRRRLRSLLESGDEEAVLRALRDLAADPESSRRPASTTLLLARGLRRAGDAEGEVALLERAVTAHPGDVWINDALAQACDRLGRREEALRYYSAARALRPEMSLRMARLLERMGRHDEADRIYGDLVQRDPDHYALGFYGMFLGRRGRAAEADAMLGRAVEAVRDAIRRRPGEWVFRSDLCWYLERSDKFEEQLAEFREWIRLRPEDPSARFQFGQALYRQGRRDEAIAAHLEAIRLTPRWSGRSSLERAARLSAIGRSLEQQGEYDEAIAGYREAVRLEPDEPSYRRQLEDAERKAEVAERLPAVLSGEAMPADDAERLAMASICYETARFAAAARLWAAALESDPALAEDRRAQHRYNAACAAALAADGQGEDRPRPDDAARAGWRHRALDWLRAELVAWSAALDSGDPQAGAAVAPTLRHWRRDPDLAGVRDPDALAALPEVDRTDWQEMWTEVDRLLERADPAP